MSKGRTRLASMTSLPATTGYASCMRSVNCMRLALHDAGLAPVAFPAMSRIVVDAQTRRVHTVTLARSGAIP